MNGLSSPYNFQLSYHLTENAFCKHSQRNIDSKRQSLNKMPITTEIIIDRLTFRRPFNNSQIDKQLWEVQLKFHSTASHSIENTNRNNNNNNRHNMLLNWWHRSICTYPIYRPSHMCLLFVHRKHRWESHLIRSVIAITNDNDHFFARFRNQLFFNFWFLKSVKAYCLYTRIFTREVSTIFLFLSCVFARSLFIQWRVFWFETGFHLLCLLFDSMYVEHDKFFVHPELSV